MDETYIRVKGQWRYWYRAVDKHGHTLDFLLTAHRDNEAACRFLKKAIGRHGIPETITIDGSDANEAIMKRYNQEYGTAMVIRQGKYLNNIVEQDHRAVKRITRPMLGLKSFDAAQGTLAGVALIRMLQQRQRMVEAGDESLTAFEQFYALAASSPSTEALRTSKRLHTKICDKAKENAMSAVSSSPTWRHFLATVAAAGAFGLVLLTTPCSAQTATEKATTVAQSETTPAAIRPFRANVPEDAFDVVIPSIPGFGFSGKPAGTGWDPAHIARVWAQLMKCLGYARYVAQGGDWGAPISSAMARQVPAGLLGIHLNYPASVPPEIDKAVRNGDPAPAGMSVEENAAFESIRTFAAKGSGYRVIMGTRPQTLGYGLADSPVAFAAFMYDYNGGEPLRSLTKDEVLDNVTLYWLTNTAASAARIYWENDNKSNTSASVQKTAEISLPVAVTVFPGEIYRAPKSWTQRAYRNLIYFHEVDKGGHFAAWEQPQLFSEELRAAFRSLR
jgi:pimeloyl-ACP methyl ester carboxylesterase